MYSGPFITGRGLVTALGDSLSTTWDRLLTGDYLSTHSPAQLASAGKLPRVSQLAIHAAREAIAEARWGGDVLRDSRTALLVSTSRGPINEWLTSPPSGCPIGIHAVANDLAAELQIGAGPRLTYSAACASSLHALIRATMMLRSGEADRAIVVGAEASLHPLFLACFKRLGVLPSQGIGCRPFDVTREGFLVSEAAAAVCLENGKSARSGLSVGRVAMGSDASTITSSDPSGVVLQTLLAHVIGDQSIDLFHAHGTGTVSNDAVELGAIEINLCARDVLPILYSHKAALGHSLGASGLISVVLNCEMHARGLVPANVRTLTQLPAKKVRLVNAAGSHSIRRSVCIAAGFGGPVAVVGLVTS